jgi:hypothetical protein
MGAATTSLLYSRRATASGIALRVHSFQEYAGGAWKEGIYIKRENWRRTTCRTSVEPEVLTQKGKEMQRECAQGVLNRGFLCEEVIWR